MISRDKTDVELTAVVCQTDPIRIGCDGDNLCKHTRLTWLLCGSTARCIACTHVAYDLKHLPSGCRLPCVALRG